MTVNFLGVTLVALALLLVNQVGSVLARAAQLQYQKGFVLELIALSAAQNVAILLPFGLVIGIVLAFGRLYHDSEMTALQGCGFSPARLLGPLSVFALVIAAGLAWLTFVQVPLADHEAQLLRQSAAKEAQFGQLDAGRFRSFMSGGGDAVFYAERVDAEGVLHNVFVRRETGERIEVALADTATYSKAGTSGMHFVTLFNGRRYEGVPGHSDFRVIEFSEHGIPIVTPEQTLSTENDPDTKPTRLLIGSSAPADIAQLQFRASSPIMAMVLTLMAVPLSRVRPRQGRYARVGFAIVVYLIYANLLSACKVWIEKGQLPPVIGVWWVHILAVSFGLYLVYREGRGT